MDDSKVVSRLRNGAVPVQIQSTSPQCVSETPD